MNSETSKNPAAPEWIIWDSSYSTRIKSMDEEHKILFSLMNNTFDVIKKNVEADAKKVLNELLSFTKKHFGSEEKLMQDYNYPNYASHKNAHERLLGILSGLIEEYTLHPHQNTGQQLIDFIKQWLTAHIMGVDKKYGSFLNRNGVF